jgi:3-hydroxyacyl-CoA dehydrogenase / enoyl-CoA hydratase / 3-hydroxybutyryl-CoA epimerase
MGTLLLEVFPLVRTATSDPHVTMAPPRTVRHTVRPDQICLLTFDRPGSAANILDQRTLAELNEELDFIERQPQLRGVVLTSAKRSIFITGADLNMLGEEVPNEAARKLIEFGQSVMNRLAALAVPTVAAIHGAAVGGGCEVCLACDYRIASTDRATKIGLPETQLGLLPAWGGSTRLPRLIGLPKALEVILSGKTLAPKPALKSGLVDELAPAEYLLQQAVKMISRGKPHRPNRWLWNNGLVAAVLAARLRPQLMKRTRGNYPAVLKALDVVTRGISKSIPKSLELEREGVLELLQTEACHNLVRVFFLTERARKRTAGGTTPQDESKPIERAAVLGAGAMGAGITQWLSACQLPVILRDVNTEQVAKGLGSIAKVYQEGVKRHVFTLTEARAGLDRISPAPMEVPLRRVDLVIEAAVENLEVKKQIFQRLDELAGDDTILATNTSALPISELAAGTRRPERVVGLHFFNPVHRMQLVEIVVGRQTAPEVVQRALRFVQQIGKLPVIVKNSPGFLVNRILMPYLLEAGRLFEAGASVVELDEAMLDFGMPMGPMRLLDEVGLDVALHVAHTLAASFSDRMTVPESLIKMTHASLLGRKSGRGFYVHNKSKEALPNPQTASFVLDRRAANWPRLELQERMLLLMINEAARCLEEGIVSDPGDVDFAMIMGTGFAPFRGGPLRHADALGATKLVGAMEHLVDTGAPDFKPSALLRNLAVEQGTFYHNK